MTSMRVAGGLNEGGRWPHRQEGSGVATVVLMLAYNVRDFRIWLEHFEFDGLVYSHVIDGNLLTWF